MDILRFRFLPPIHRNFFFLLRRPGFSSIEFSSVPILILPTLAAFDFGTDEDPQKPVQVFEVQRAVCA